MATVSAIFNKLDGSAPVRRDVELELRGDYVWMRGGPTGYESAPAAGLAAHGDRDWAACIGTEGRWARCVVPASALRAGLVELGVLADG